MLAFRKAIPYSFKVGPIRIRGFKGKELGFKGFLRLFPGRAINSILINRLFLVITPLLGLFKLSLELGAPFPKLLMGRSY